MNNYSCAPNKVYNEDSCFSLEDLQLIANAYNIEFGTNININLSKKQLVKELESKFTNCSDHYCWLTNSNVKLKNLESKYKLINNTFRPLGPKSSANWLSTININDVMKQYEKKYIDFNFIGAVPYDFKYLNSKISHIDFNTYIQKNIFKFGLIINLDEHYKPGSHWVSLFFDLNKNQIYYFDSNGKKPRHNIRSFITKIVKFFYKQSFNKKINTLNIKNNDNNILNIIDIKSNNIKHQLGNTECGVYSINFIVRLLNNEPYLDIVNNISKDEDMLECRKVYFN